MSKRSLVLALSVALGAVGFAADASASCRIRNTTKYSFKVKSGNTSNQSVGSNTTTSIASGKILAKSKEGKSFGGMCKNGDSIVVKEEKGVVFMELK